MMMTMMPQQEQQQQQQRDSLNGAWILDKTRGDWSMKHYLATMDVDPLAIEAHEKGEIEHETIHTIELTPATVTIVKCSRVNNNLKVSLEIGKESIEYLPPGKRVKRMIANSSHPGHLEIHSSIQTMNGVASVTDIKNLVQEENNNIATTSVMVQQLTVTNEGTGKSCTTTRHFIPYETPPHLIAQDDTVLATDTSADVVMST